MLRGDASGFLKIQISNSLKDLKRHLERCNEAHVKILELSNSIEDSKWIDNLYVLYDEIKKRSLNYFENVAKSEAERCKRNVAVRLERTKMPTFSGDLRGYA